MFQITPIAPGLQELDQPGWGQVQLECTEPRSENIPWGWVALFPQSHDFRIGVMQFWYSYMNHCHLERSLWDICSAAALPLRSAWSVLKYSYSPNRPRVSI